MLNWSWQLVIFAALFLPLPEGDFAEQQEYSSVTAYEEDFDLRNPACCPYPPPPPRDGEGGEDG